MASGGWASPSAPASPARQPYQAYPQAYPGSPQPYPPQQAPQAYPQAPQAYPPVGPAAVYQPYPPVGGGPAYQPYQVAAYPGQRPLVPPVVAFRDGRPVPVSERVDVVPGTEFGVALAQVPPTVSGTAIGSLVAGIAADLVAVVTTCIGTGTPAGVAASGAFAILGTVAGAASIGLGLVAARQIRASAGRLTGRGMAIAGVSCAAVGILITGLGVLAAVLVHTGGAA